ncbi:hypothetical protein H3C65_01470 [Patescibacteria group bacterium]|nr:hypothetical protein [Patescibacteria group bacterium]
MTEVVKATQGLSDQILSQANRYKDNHPHKTLALSLARIAAEDATPANSSLEALLNDRPMPVDHITPIIFATAQYADTQAGVSRDFGAMTSEEWGKYLSDLFHANDPVIMRVLRERNVQSFILRRYFPAKILARMAFGDAPINALDVGCSLNLGLQAVSKDQGGEMFPGLNVQDIPQEAYSGRVNVSSGLGIDLHEPDVDWITSCIWPDHESEKDLIRQTYEKLNGQNPNIIFRRISALELDKYPELKERFDLIIASGMLYQLTPEEEKIFLQQIGQVAKPKAWFLATDYPKGVSYKQPFSYTTWAQQVIDTKFNEQLEFIKADDPFTTVVKPGKDFVAIEGRK